MYGGILYESSPKIYTRADREREREREREKDTVFSPVYFKRINLRAFGEQFALILKWVELLGFYIMWLLTPPKTHPPTTPWENIGENTKI